MGRKKRTQKTARILKTGPKNTEATIKNVFYFDNQAGVGEPGVPYVFHHKHRRAKKNAK